MTEVNDCIHYKAKIVKNGNSLVVKVTSPARILGLNLGDEVEITIRPATSR